MERLTEDALIAAIAALAKRGGVAEGPGVELGIGHDCAVLSLARGEELAWHVDDQVEDVHFRRRWASFEDVGWKGAGAALSDLAAVGARPLGVQLALELPRDLADADVLSVVRGFTRALARDHVPLVGGNVAARPAGSGLSLSVSVAGAVKRGRAFRRDTARPGDGLYLSGTPGLAGLGLAHLERGLAPRGRAGARAVAAFLRPRPRLDLGLALASLTGRGRPHAVTDTSDGLARDVRKIAGASGLRASLDLAALPLAELSRAARALGNDLDPVRQALQGGEDYELLVAASGTFERAGIASSFVRIGRLSAGVAGLVELVGPDGTVFVGEDDFRHR